MEWEGKQLETMGQFYDAAFRIYREGDHEKGQAFLNAYRAISEYADENLGYLAGYSDRESMVGFLQFFGVRHPIFGGPDEAKEVTAEKAFALGVQIGESLREEGQR